MPQENLKWPFNVNYDRLSKVEKRRIDIYLMRNANIDDRFEPRHPNRSDNSRRAMRDLVRYRNKKATGRYGGQTLSNTATS